MLREKVEKALNEQINAEMWSAYLYLSMSAWCHTEGHPGMASWYEVQFREEQDHAMILYNYVNARGGRVLLAPIAAVPTCWDGVLDVLEATLKHEREVTAMICSLYALAGEEDDYATQSRMQWFVDEQVEEEGTAQENIDKARMVGTDGYGIYMLDKELGTRSYSPASPLSE